MLVSISSCFWLDVFVFTWFIQELLYTLKRPIPGKFGQSVLFPLSKLWLEELLEWMSDSAICQVLLSRRVYHQEGVAPIDCIHESQKQACTDIHLFHSVLIRLSTLEIRIKTVCCNQNNFQAMHFALFLLIFFS